MRADKAIWDRIRSEETPIPGKYSARNLVQLTERRPQPQETRAWVWGITYTKVGKKAEVTL